MKHWWRRIWLLPVGLLVQLAAGADGAAGVIERFAGAEARVVLEALPGAGAHEFEAGVHEGQQVVRANSPVAHCRGFYSAVRRSGRGICSWSGRRFAPGHALIL